MTERTCLIDVCDRPAGSVIGYCKAHYWRWKNGTAIPLHAPIGAPGRPTRVVPEGTRWCHVCRVPHPADQIPDNQRACRYGRYLRHLKNKFGLAPETYEQMMRDQDGLCAICCQRPAKYVDHDHRTGRVRGVLCNPCNSALGAFDDDPETFARALAYLGKVNTDAS